MRTPEEVRARITELNAKLLLVKSVQDQELNKPFADADLQLLRFLRKECDVYSFSITQLEWLLAE